MFDGFSSAQVRVDETTVFIRRKGSGPPLLLLHGFPQTHLMWHRVAPALADQFTVVCADLRGYGASGKPESRPDHAPYAKSALALDLVQMMEVQGFSQFRVAGHDRGARVAYRMALDHPARVERVAVLDVIPTGDVFLRTAAQFAFTYWPWSLLSQPEPLPEKMLLAAPDAVVDDALGNWGSHAASFPADIREAYINALRDPVAVHAICEEYRAAATLDLAKDTEDQAAGRRIACPLLVLWGERGPLDLWYREAGGPLGVWQHWATQASGRAISGGHFFPEQNPSETVKALSAFFRLSPAT